MSATPSPSTNADAQVLARLPLQIGTTSVWSAGRAAAALFPGFALIGVAIWMIARLDGGSGRLVIALAVGGGMLIFYAATHIASAVRTRASDVLLFGGGLTVDGGRLHGERIPWSELTAPYAEIEDTKVQRVTIVSILGLILTLLARSSTFGGATSAVQVWRLHVHRGGTRRLIAETDRPIERDSMAAAASSVSAVVSGQRYVAEAPTVPTTIVRCGQCGAPAVPDDAAAVTCTFCNASIPLPNEIRGQAAASKAMAHSRGTTTNIIAKLREQPEAASTNVGLFAFAVVMFGAWPLGWGLIAFRVLADGFQASDVVFLLLPFAAVAAGFFLARARLADRGALQLLTLGFGALSPASQGEPSRCRRCQGPLPSAGLGGVTQCRYCASENIVGLDLRPTVTPARVEQTTFDTALQKRAAEKRLWTILSVVAIVALAGWVVSTALYIVHMDSSPRAPAHETSKPHPKSTGGKHGK